IIMIRKEKVSFKQLQRRGNQISIELNHEAPSSKWYGRFLRRHGLSLQKPDRHKKIPLNEVHKLVHEFHTYYEDQGHISSKRFCTLILTIFGEDNSRIGPILLFKGKGKISENEKAKYAKDIKVFFTPKAVNSRQTMDKYINYWISKIKDNKPKLFITDSSSTHLNDATLRLLRKEGVVAAVIPKGVQCIYKHWIEEFTEKYGPRSKIKLSASQSRVLCTRLTSSAWKRTLINIDIKRAFINLGYTWTDDSLVQPRTLPGY
ncbi:unnamed protein product, partial [Rotaria socialis]